MQLFRGLIEEVKVLERQVDQQKSSDQITYSAIRVCQAASDRAGEGKSFA